MENIDFLAKVLRDNSYYWLVAKKNIARVCLEDKRVDDNILLICIDHEFAAPKEEREITLSLLKSLQKSEPPNIFLCNSYSPFQMGVSMYNVYDGEPIPNDLVNAFLIASLELDSKNIWEYKKLLKSLQEKSEDQSKEQ